ncbi:RagB/SusD family nutrient uptake outer membrane protein [uncultured Algoriphagus sp.]|uniref:RagB/SusD family nutrient uptake outer membrane protein n=1 Tax=uncultured Algoriphagus sp. TaxID=417365 RepID=UPI0030EEC887|tara:strand:- start:66859 stop:68352 length:1494 start_codon:yes stop_codon:yes gene_type:complete
MFKHIKNISLLTLVMITMGSCWELDQEVLDGVTQQQVNNNSTDPNLINVLKASAYSRIVGSWGAHNSIWSMHEVSSDEMVVPQKGADWADGGLWLRMHRHVWLPSDDVMNNTWNYCYTAVGEINNLLVQYPDLPQLKSELSVLRGLVYLWLIDIYGNVPIITEDDLGGNAANNSRQEVFDFIEQSVLDNIDALTKDDTKTTINYYSAQAILAKLYLNAEVYTGTPRWADAEIAADAIISSGVYSLSTNYFANFATRNNGSTENILTLPYDENNAPGFNLPMMTLHGLNQQTFDLQEQPWNGYSSMEEFYNSYEDVDVRKDNFLVGPQYSSSGERLMDVSFEENDPDGAPLTFTPFINMLEPNALRQSGVRINKFEFAPGSNSNLSNDYPIFRYADIIMVKAEAAFRQGKLADALDYMNQIRNRAGVDPYTALTLDDIYDERGREMFAEASRRTDMIRFGKFSEPWWEKEASAPFRYIFPIPQTQINTNPNLTQNPGY